MKKKNFLYEDAKKTQLDFTSNSLILSNNDLKNFFFFFKKFLALIKNADKDKASLINLMIHFRFIHLRDYYCFLNKSKELRDFVFTAVMEDIFIEFNFFFFDSIFYEIYLDKGKNISDILERFFIFRGLEEYNEYWNTSVNRDNKLAKITRRKQKIVKSNKLYLPSLNDKLIIKRYDLYNTELRSDFNNIYRQDIASLPETPKLFKSPTRKFSFKFEQQSFIRSMYANYYNRNFKNYKDNSILLLSNSFNKSLLSEKNKNFLFWFRFLKKRKYNQKIKSGYFYRFFHINKVFNFKKNLKKKNYFQIRQNNKNRFFKEISWEDSNNLSSKVLNYFYKKHNNNFIKNDLLYKINPTNDIVYNNWNLKFYDFTKLIDLKNQLTCIYNIITNNNLTLNSLFTFTSDNFIENMNFFYQYQFDKWILKIMFSNLNITRLFFSYFSDIFNDDNLNNFFFFKKIHMTNIINPNFLTAKLYNNLIKITIKNKYYNVINLVSNIITTYFYKFYFSNYNIFISKISNNIFSDTILNSIQSLFNSIEFDVIRKDFIFEFIYVCSFTFITKDPKPLVNWIVKVIHKINYRKHWKFFFLLQINICSIASIFLNETNLAGFYLTIKGKLGSTGSVRKKIVRIKMGQYGFSRYYLKGDIYYLGAFTLTGKIGLKMIINYY